MSAYTAAKLFRLAKTRFLVELPAAGMESLLRTGSVLVEGAHPNCKNLIKIQLRDLIKEHLGHPS